jgi:hypothetical protein
MARSRLHISELLEEQNFYMKHQEEKIKWINSKKPFFEEVLHLTAPIKPISELARQATLKTAK